MVLLAVSMLTFGVTRIAGTPLYAAVGVYSTDEMIEARKELMGLNKPIWEQYASYVAGLARGDLGSSRRTFAPVRDEIANRLPATAELVAFAVVLAIAWAVPIGALAAFRPRGWADRHSAGTAARPGRHRSAARPVPAPRSDRGRTRRRIRQNPSRSVACLPSSAV